MPPSLSWAHWGADGGDLVTAVALGRLPHPPGFPMYLLMGRAFWQFPWGDPAWKLNLFSAVSAALAAGITAFTVWKILSSPTVAIVAGLSLGLAPLFWSQALIAEVYAPAALFSATFLFLALHQAPAWLLGVVWGLSIGIHPTLSFLAPLLAGKNHKHKSFIRAYLCPILFALLMTGILYGPVLLTWGKKLSPWADFSSLTGWWAYVSGRLYHGYLFSLPVPLWPRRFLAWAGLMAQQFTPIGALLVFWGWARLWREQRGLALATSLAFSALNLYAIGYNTADSLVYIIPTLPLAALWLGAGLDNLRACLLKARGRLSQFSLSCLLLLPALQAMLFWGRMDIHHDRSAIVWAQGALETASPGAILLTSQDGATFALWYVRDVLGKRPDVWVVDRDLLGYPPYRRFLSMEWGIEPYESLENFLEDMERSVIVVHAPLEE